MNIENKNFDCFSDFKKLNPLEQFEHILWARENFPEVVGYQPQFSGPYAEKAIEFLEDQIVELKQEIIEIGAGQ